MLNEPLAIDSEMVYGVPMDNVVAPVVPLVTVLPVPDVVLLVVALTTVLPFLIASTNWSALLVRLALSDFVTVTVG